MDRIGFTSPTRRRPAAARVIGSAWALGTACALALAQPAPRSEGLTLSQAFEAAWARQPEHAALAARRDAAYAQQRAAAAWTPEPVALDLAGKTDRLNRRLGTHEIEAGVAIPLWLPGERGRSQALAQAEGLALESRALAARLRVAAVVREAWWNVQRARADAAVAQAQLDNAQRIAADVARRLKAGDLAQADLHQADAAVAAAQAARAQAQGAEITTVHTLRALVSAPVTGALSSLAEPLAEPVPHAAAQPLDDHAELQALKDRVAVAAGLSALTATQSRSHPELTLATTRDRGGSGEPWQQTVTLALRIPLGGGPRHDARMAAARADQLELQAQIELERARLAGEREAARARTDAARLQLAAADQRARLTRETRGFFDKSFRLGETDLPTRLRVEAEAAEAERQAARARIELAAAISAWRQALGLLPP